MKRSWWQLTDVPHARNGVTLMAACLALCITPRMVTIVHAQPAPTTPAPTAPATTPPATPAPTTPAEGEAVPAEGEPTPAEGEGMEPPTEEPAPEAELEPAPLTAPLAEDVAPSVTLEDAEEAREPTSAPDNWTQPLPVLTLHGYMRVRGEIQDTFWLGRGIDTAAEGPDPFTPFRSSERAACADSTSATACAKDTDTLSYGTLRLRLSPELNISDDVRVKMTFDAFDNVIAGSGPSTFYDPSFGRTYASTLNAGSVVVRRAWAEVRNRSLGELRFGRMPAHWGLGMVQNAGNRIDDDQSTEVDRVMVISEPVIDGLILSAAYDFTGEGAVRQGPAGLPLDASQSDDVDQFSFTASYRLTPEQEEDALTRGDYTIQGGAMFNYRVQDTAARRELVGFEPPDMPSATDDELVTINATSYNLDAWGQLKWRGLRVEAEAAVVMGSVSNTRGDDAVGEMSLLQFGSALETELRLLDDKLGLYFYSGIATGDPDSNGLSSNASFVGQDGDRDDTISTFRFHPTYRVDLILWRNLMQQVTGAYYFKPGVSYDFVRDPFGQLLGARVDLIWSRAVFSGQTWGGDPNLGVEINASLYWRGEDGPELDDGFHAMVQYGILFPMQGLWYRSSVATDDTGTVKNAADELQTAQTLRLVLGVVY